MSNFRVRWSINVDAETHEEALALGSRWLIESVKEGIVNLEVVNRDTQEREFLRAAWPKSTPLEQEDTDHD